MQWLPKMTVGNVAIDAAHKALFAEMQGLLGGANAELDEGLLCLSDRLERDFREEESLMEALDFSGIRHHRAEHARVLSALHHVAPGDVVAAREVLQLMSLWFPMHVTTMDAELAAALRRGAGAAEDSADGTSAHQLRAAEEPAPGAEELRLMADTMPGEGPGD
jgi:hemerythrin-like metal-binding protein